MDGAGAVTAAAAHPLTQIQLVQLSYLLARAAVSCLVLTYSHLGHSAMLCFAASSMAGGGGRSGPPPLQRQRDALPDDVSQLTELKKHTKVCGTVLCCVCGGVRGKEGGCKAPRVRLEALPCVKL